MCHQPHPDVLGYWQYSDPPVEAGVYRLEDQTIFDRLLPGQGAAPLDAQRNPDCTDGAVDATSTPRAPFISRHRFTTLPYPRLARRVHQQLRLAWCDPPRAERA